MGAPPPPAPRFARPVTLTRALPPGIPQLWTAFGRRPCFFSGNAETSRLSSNDSTKRTGRRGGFAAANAPQGAQADLAALIRRRSSLLIAIQREEGRQIGRSRLPIDNAESRQAEDRDPLPGPCENFLELDGPTRQMRRRDPFEPGHALKLRMPRQFYSCSSPAPRSRSAPATP